MSYDKSIDRNRRAARDWSSPQIGDYVFVHNEYSVLHGLPAKIVGIKLACADLDFGCDIAVPGQAPLKQRIWRIPLDELKSTPPTTGRRKRGQS